MSRNSPRIPNRLDALLKVFLVVVILLFVLKLMFIEESNEPPVSVQSRTNFAKCLNESGVIMYGVDTCEYCETQKKMFGDDFKEIAYVNCDFSTEQCLSKGITAYPVWQIETKRLVGIQTFSLLAEVTGCEEPI